MRFKHASLSVAFVLGLATGALGQVAGTTGAVNGRVSDESNAVLPGVTVTISGPAMMGTQVAVTNEQGLYRFPSLPPGEYRLNYELVGFSTVEREGIRVGGAFTATVNVEMKVASLEETITVSGASPVVDTQATRIQTNFTSAQLASLPSARDMWAILAESPAVQVGRFDVGGANAGTQTPYSAYGTSGRNRPMIEGIVITQSASGASWMYYDYGSFDEVVVGTAAHGADMPTPGVQMQFISKSGGNAFHGGIYADYENERIQSRNVDPEQIRGGAASTEVNRLFRYYDFNGDAGGPLKRDTLWWYGSFRDQKIQSRFANFPVKPFLTRLTNPTGKVTYQVSPNNKLIAYAQGNRKFQPNRFDGGRVSNPIHPSADSTWQQVYWAWIWKGEWDRVVNDHVFFEIRGAGAAFNWEQTGHTAEPRREDIGTNIVTGGNRHFQQRPRRNQVIGMVSVFKDRWAGTHNFKFGGEFFRETLTENWLDGGPDNVRHIFNNGAAIEVEKFLSPTFSENGLWVYSAYANDNWDVSSRIGLNLGLRFDGYQPFLPEQEHPVGRFFPVARHFDAADKLLRWNLFAPRLGLVYKLTEDGRTVLKANAGRYWWTPGVDLASAVNPNTPGQIESFTWTDLNGDRIWQQGEEGRLISRTGGSTQRLDPNLENSYTNELASWFEREMMPNFGLRTGIVWRGERQLRQNQNILRPFDAFNVPVQIRDPGLDGRTGTADDGPLLTLFNLDPARLGLVENLLTNVPGKNDYYTWEISGNRRMSRGWSLLTGFSYTRTLDHQRAYFRNSVRNNELPVSPNDTINRPADGRHHFGTWAFKIHGTYAAPWDFKITPLLRHQSGQPFGRTFVARLNFGSQVVLAEPIDSRRQDNVTLFDLRVEKVFRLTARTKVSAFLDGYNLFNANPEQNIAWSSGSSFLRPLSIVPPRIFRFGTKFEW